MIFVSDFTWFIHVAVNGIISFLWLNNIPYIYIYIYSRLLPCLDYLNSAAVNTGMHIFFQTMFFCR